MPISVQIPRICKRCGKPYIQTRGDVITPFDPNGSSEYCFDCYLKMLSGRDRTPEPPKEKPTEKKDGEAMKNNEQEQTIFAAMAEDVKNANIPEEDKSKLLKNIARLQKQKINLMITGATGCGKSSTINALFDMEVAKVGVGVDPETQDIAKYELGNLILWDTPGLGDGKEADARHAANIRRKLLEKDADGNALIDLVLVVLDGSSRDLGTSYDLINEVILPNLGGTNAEKSKRVLVAINQCDVAMKGRYWNYAENRPEPELTAFLEDKVRSVHDRIKESTGVDIEPIYYSAGFTDGNQPQKPYNLSKLLYFLIQYTPLEKRMIYVDNITKDKENLKHDDDEMDYNRESVKTLWESIKEGARKGADIGGEIGSMFGETGEKIGRAAGGVVGGAVAVFRKIRGIFPW